MCIVCFFRQPGKKYVCFAENLMWEIEVKLLSTKSEIHRYRTSNAEPIFIAVCLLV